VLSLWWRGLTAPPERRQAWHRRGHKPRPQQACPCSPPAGHGWWRVVVVQPAAWTVPLAFTTMVLVSRRGRPPAGAEQLVLSMHVPDTAAVDV